MLVLLNIAGFCQDVFFCTKYEEHDICRHSVHYNIMLLNSQMMSYGIICGVIGYFPTILLAIALFNRHTKCPLHACFEGGNNSTGGVKSSTTHSHDGFNIHYTPPDKIHYTPRQKILHPSWVWV